MSVSFTGERKRVDGRLKKPHVFRGDRVGVFEFVLVTLGPERFFGSIRLGAGTCLLTYFCLGRRRSASCETH